MVDAESGVGEGFLGLKELLLPPRILVVAMITSQQLFDRVSRKLCLLRLR